MKVADRAYLAGFLDGEGSFMLIRCGGESVEYYAIRVSVSNTYLPILEWCQALLPGRLYTFQQSNSRKNENARLIHRLDWHDRSAAPVLRAVAPYVRVKTAQVRLLLELTEHREKQEAERKPYTRRDPNVVTMFRAAHTEMKAMNKRGVK